MKKILCVLIALYSIRCFAGELFEPHPLNRAEGRKCSVSLCCVFQNEGEWLQEWIEYHKLIGVGHFYLYNNLSTDHYLEVLSPYLASGDVELFNYPKSPFIVADQVIIYQHAFQLSLEQSDWLTAIDTDEFIVPLKTKHLISYLDQFSESIGAIEIKWVTFGTSHVKKLKPGELLIERLILRAPINSPINIWHKTIARTDAIEEWTSAHSCRLKEGFQIFQAADCCEGEVPENEESVSQIRIHHYVWRTEDYFHRIKLPRIENWNVNLFHLLSPMEFLSVTNSIFDYTMKEFVPLVKEKIRMQSPLQSFPCMLDNGFQ